MLHATPQVEAVAVRDFLASVQVRALATVHGYSLPVWPVSLAEHTNPASAHVYPARMHGLAMNACCAVCVQVEHSLLGALDLHSFGQMFNRPYGRAPCLPPSSPKPLR